LKSFEAEVKTENSYVKTMLILIKKITFIAYLYKVMEKGG
jgi:hypothetical protein